MFKWLARLALAKKAWDWYTEYKRKKNASNQSGGSFGNDHRLGD